MFLMIDRYDYNNVSLNNLAFISVLGIENYMVRPFYSDFMIHSVRPVMTEMKVLKCQVVITEMNIVASSN